MMDYEIRERFYLYQIQHCQSPLFLKKRKIPGLHVLYRQCCQHTASIFSRLWTRESCAVPVDGGNAFKYIRELLVGVKRYTQMERKPVSFPENNPKTHFRDGARKSGTNKVIYLFLFFYISRVLERVSEFLVIAGYFIREGCWDV